MLSLGLRPSIEFLKTELRCVWGFLLALVFLFSASAVASNQSIVYQGRILRPDGTVLNSGSLTFTLALYSPAPKKCLLYSETQTLNMTGSSGMFSLALGSGNRSDGGVHAFDQVFVNGGALSSLTCADGSTSYSPAGTDDRSLVASFNDNGTVVTLSAMEIKSIPFALQAHQIGGYGINDIIKVHPTTGSATTFTTAEMGKVRAIGAASCANNEILKWNGTTWACAPDATGGSPSDASYSAKGILQFDTDAATSGVSVTSGVAKLSDVLSTPGTFGSATKTVTLTVNSQGRITAAAHQDIAIPASQITASGASNGEVLKWNGTAWAPAADATGTSPGDASYATKGLVQGLTDQDTSGLKISSGVISVNTGTGANQIVKLDSSGKLPAVDGSALTNITATGYSGVLPVANGGTNSNTALNNNRLMLSSGGKIVEASAMTNGQIVVGSTGAAPAIATLGNSNGITITPGAGSLSIGTNATDANTASTIVSRDASGNFAAGAVTNTSNILKGSTSGQITMTVPGTVTPYTLTWPSGVGSAGSFLTTDASGNLSWGSPAAVADASYSAKGTVQGLTNAATSGLNIASGVISVNSGTSANQIVKLDGSSKLPAVDGSALTNLAAANITGTVPVANGGTGAATLTSNGVLLGNGTSAVTATSAGSANSVLRIPSGGGAPAFGAIDISQSATVTGVLPPGSGGTGQSSYTAGDMLYATGAAATSKLGIGASGTILSSNGSAPVWGTISSLGMFVNGGNSFGATATLGTNDSHSLAIETAGATRMTILSDGKVGIGTTGPVELLDVRATDASPTISVLNRDSTTGQHPKFVVRNYTGATTAGFSSFVGSNSRGNLTTSAPVESGDVLVRFVGSGTVDNANNYVDGAQIRVIATEDWSGAGTGAALIFRTNANTVYNVSDEKMRIHHNGKVGIGTNDPKSRLHVSEGIQLGNDPATCDATKAGTFRYTAGNVMEFCNSSAWTALAASGTFADASHSTKGIVQFDTNTATSGMIVSSGVVKVNFGTGANQLIQLDGSAKLPALDGSALTNLSATNITDGTLPVGRGGTGLTAGTSGGIPYYSATNTMASSALLTQNGVVLGGGAGAAPTTTAAGAADTVLRVPSGGGAPAFGSIDLSKSAAVTGTLAIGNGGTGRTAFDVDRLVGTNGAGALVPVTCSQGQVLSFNVSGVYGCYNVGSIFNGFVDGGNTFTATATLGTNSNHNLEIETNGTTKMTVLADGKVGIGTTSPGTLFHSLTSGATANTMTLESGAGGSGLFQKSTGGAASITQQAIGGVSSITQTRAGAAWAAVGNHDVTGVITTQGFNGTAFQDTSQIKSETDGVPAGGNIPGRMSFHTSSSAGALTERMRITSSGRVGIGTTAPSGTLHLWGPGTNGSESTLYFGDQDNSTNPLIRERLPGDTDQLDISAREGLFFRTNGSDRVTIDKNGNVGIGTTSPGAKLQIYSSSTIPETWKQIQVINMSNSGSSAAYNALIGLDFSGTNSVTGAGTTESFATTTTLSSTSDAKMQMITGHMVDLTTHASDAGWGFLVRNQYQGNSTGGTQYGVVLQMGDTDVTNYGIHQSGANVINYFQGKVGVGNASPAASALVDIDSTTKGFLIPRMTETQRDAITTPATGLQIYNTTTNLLNFYNGTAWTVLSTGGGSYLSSSGGTLSGNLAMGTNSITSIGGITGNGALTVAAGGSNQNLTLSSTGTGSVNATTGNGTQFSILNGPASTVNYVTVQGAAAGGSPVIGTAGSDANINLTLTPKGTGNTIFSSGKVGIGASSPAQILQVNGSIGATGGISSTNAAGIYLYDNGTSGIVGSFANSSGARPMLMMGQTLGFYTGSPSYTEKMSLDATGKLGIGATSPSANLEVRSTGNSTVSGNGIRVTASDYATNGGYLTINKASGTSSVGSIQVGDTANYGPLILNASGGFVGVGTTTPDSKLDIYNVETRTTASKFAAVEGGVSVEPTAGLAGNAHRSAIYGQAIVPGTVTNAVRNIYGVDGLANYLGSGGAYNVVAGNFYSYNGGSGATNNMIGAYGGADASGSGTVANLTGVQAESYGYSGTVTNQYGVSVYMESSAGIVANRYGIYLHTPVGTATNDYGIYQEPDKNNYFKGNVGINDATPETKLKVQGTLKVEAGQIYVAEQTSSAASPLTFNTDSGNAMLWTSNTVSPTVNVHNLKAGGAYTLTVRGTGTGTVTINCYSDAGTTALTSSFVPANGARTTGTANITVYNILRTGNYCLVTWITGF